VTDKGTRPYSIKIGSHVTPVIDPGHSMLVHVQWTVRGQFLYETLYQGKPLGPKGYVTVF
jgi:hypothetical protein